MAAALTGLTILVPESRELDLFVAMLEAEGASAWRCPLLRILDLEAPPLGGTPAGDAPAAVHLSPEGRGRIAPRRDPGEGARTPEFSSAPRTWNAPSPGMAADASMPTSLLRREVKEPDRPADASHSDLAQAETWIDALIGGRFEDTVWLTGEGLRRLIGIAERRGCRAAFTAALGHVRLITRGPKPARVLRELGLAPGVAAATPTSQGVLDALAGQDLRGRRMGVQLYPGDGALPLVAALRERGAEVFPITPYRYADQAEDAQVIEAIRALVDGRIGMVAFTSSPQVERLFEVARTAGLAAQLAEAFRHVRVAAIGPVVGETLRAHAITEVLRPESSFHLKPLVRAIAAGWERSAV